MKETDTFALKEIAKINLPRRGLIFKKIKESALGENYRLSLVFATAGLSRKLNEKYRGKNRPADILTFSLGDNDGEIFIAPKIAAIKAKDFNRPVNNFIIFLFIHGLCHLKGMRHGSKMEDAETGLRKKFRI
jgi:probable rRNA maturation factor